MKIVAKVNESIKTCSGKPSLQFQCEHCKTIFLDLDTYFWQSSLNKDCLTVALSQFTDAINENKVIELFKKPTTGKKIYKNHLCNCDPNVIDIEYVRSVKRAKDILKRGLETLN